MNIEDIWNNFLTKIKSKVSLMTYNYMFKDLKIYSYKDSKITIIVPSNELLLQNLTKNYSEIIEELLNDITNDTCEIIYVFEKDVEKLEKNTKSVYNEGIPKLETDITSYKYYSNFNPKYTFDTFIVGDSNKIGRASCRERV